MSAMRYIGPDIAGYVASHYWPLQLRLFCLCHPCPRAVAVRLRDGTVTPFLSDLRYIALTHPKLSGKAQEKCLHACLSWC